jgi:hypothetical protein
LWESAKNRAKEKNLPFNITTSDIKIPPLCPMLGIALSGKSRGFAPSLDQIVPGRGYTPENIWVISQRANAIKSNLTLEQFEIFIRALRQATRMCMETH